MSLERESQAARRDVRFIPHHQRQYPHRLLDQVGPEMLVLTDAGITSGGVFEHVRKRGAHALGALEAGAWEQLPKQRRLGDGSVLAWVPPTRKGCYPMRA